MQQITEAQIAALAPNAAAASNGKKISQKGGFVKLYRSADDTFYMGECKGSGASNYITSADYIDELSPVYRCSCPSRQFPCKHSLALMYEMLAGKEFAICDIPEDILKKREKNQAKEAKAKGGEEAVPLTPEEQEKAEKKKAAAQKASKNARAKKLSKQLEGLELAKKLIADLMEAGLGTMGGTALSTYTQLSKQLGDYYLPGPQRLLNKLIIEISAFQKDQKQEHYDNAIDVLEKFWTLIKKSMQYLGGKLEQGNMEWEDNFLYEELGGVWKLSELEELGNCKKDAVFVQLAFWVECDEAGKRYVDTGCWGDVSDGAVYMTYNYRPFKSLKYINQEDTVFGMVRTASAAVYPGEGNPRVRWENAGIFPVSEAELGRLRSFAITSINAEAKSIKNILKNAMASPMLLKLAAYSQICKSGEGYVLVSSSGDNILLGDIPFMEGTTDRIAMLPEESLLKNQVLLAAFYYNSDNHRLMAQPLSIITKDSIVRLLY